MTHQEFEERLDSIFLRLWNGDYDAPYEQTLAESKQAIRDLFVEVVVGFDPTGATALTGKLRTTITGKEGE